MTRRATPKQRQPRSDGGRLLTLEQQEIEAFLGELFDSETMGFRCNMRPVVCFRSFSKVQMIHPLGPPRTITLVTTHGAERTPVSKPEVLFEGHMYSTDDANIAAGLILHDGFETREGWKIEAEACIPDPALAATYQKVEPEVRRKIALDLLRGKSPTEIVQNLTDEELKPAAGPSDSDGRPLTYSEVCQYPACGKVCAFEGENAYTKVREMMALHNLTTHRNATIPDPLAGRRAATAS